MAMTELEQHYNKFNEEKRLDSRHGRVEFITSMKYIHNCLDDIKAAMDIASDIKILDIGAGTGRYSVPLSEEGYDVTAVELVKHNLGLLKAKNSNVKAYQGNALKLKRFEDLIWHCFLDLCTICLHLRISLRHLMKQRELSSRVELYLWHIL